MNNSGWKKDYLRYKEFFLNVVSVYNTKPNLKIYLELTLSLTTIIIFSILAVRPTVLTIIDLNKEIKAKEQTLVVLKQKIKNLQAASSLMQSESENIQYIDQAVPKTGKPEVLVKQIEQLSKDSNLSILGFSASDVTLLGTAAETKKTSDYISLSNNANELPFNFSATGTYQDIYSFISSIENLRRPIKIDSLTINANKTESGKTIVTTVSGRVPFLLNNK